MAASSLPTRLALPHGGVVEGLQPVGRGAAGVVLRGELDGRAVGIKIDRQDGGAARLAQEAIARAIAGAGSPIDAGFVELGRRRRPFLAFAWVEGSPIAAARSSPIAEAIVRDVGAILARLHLLGFRHGDVKRENVVVTTTEEGARASLVDFGLAAPFGAPLTGATPENLPPEALATTDGAAHVGAEADVYALGRLVSSLSPPSDATRLATADRAGDRPSAAELAGWQGHAVPLEAAYLVERLPEIQAAACEGRAPPEGPARSWVEGIMRALASLSGTRADGAPLPGLDADGRRRLLVRLAGAVARDWPSVAADEPSLLRALAGRSDRALGPADLATALDADLDAQAAFARLSLSPGDEVAMGSLARLAAGGALEGDAAGAALILLRRAGRLAEARALAETRLRAAPHDVARALEAAELARLARDPAACAAYLADANRADLATRDGTRGSTRADVRALAARLSLDRGAIDEAEALLGDDVGGEIRALVAWTRGRWDEGLAALDALDGDAEARDPERRARALHVRGMLLHGRGDGASAARAFARAADLAVAIGAPALEIGARLSAAAAAHDAGRLGDALDASTRAIALAERLDRPGDAARARLTRAATLLAPGATTDATVEAERAHRAAERAGDRRGAAYALFTSIEAACARGERAIMQARAARAARDAPSPGERVMSTAYALLVGEDVPEEEVRAAQNDLDRVEPAAARWTLYRALLLRGRDVIDAVLRSRDVEAPPSVVGPVLSRAIAEARRAGRGDAARALSDRLGRLVSRLEEDVPLSHRASFAAAEWVETARDTAGRSEELGLAAGQIDLLAAIARGLRDRTSLGDLLRQVLDGLVLWVGVERGLLLLRAADPSAPGGVRLQPRVARGLSREDLRGTQLALSSTLARRALETMEPVVAVDASGGGDDPVSASIHALRLRSVLAVPLVARGEALGVVYLDDRIRRGAFGPREIAWVRLLSTQAAAAIADARDALRLRRLARRAERAQARLETTLARTEGTLEVVRAELAERKGARATRHGYDAIIGDGAAMRRMLALVDRVVDASDARIPVLVVGESGTGKELVARAIHDNGARRRGPFVAENCGAIPEPLLESTLFGHVRGAFTGADRARVGLFEIAHGGTLLLDEIGEMSLAMQAKLLRVLQDGEVRPVGGERSSRVDVRVIGATHRDLEAMVREGRFREDLYYRLAVLCIQVPPLRDRTEDLPALVEHFVRRWSGGRKLRVTKDALAVLASAPWPGNVRQLENELRRALVLCDGVLDVEHLSPELLQPRRTGAASGLTLRDQLDALERRLVVDALRRANGNQTHAARALGVSRFGLQKMTRRLGLPTKGTSGD
ncbi:MAG: sigma 54-interacting transcriptional regulator [Deltaproteobacteria bacterium]|nr:sigma 54-interacting transcriptional regulator [Deltaproteobacteria bacterium]